MLGGRAAKADVVKVKTPYAEVLDVLLGIGPDFLIYVLPVAFVFVVYGTYPSAVVEALHPAVDGYTKLFTFVQEWDGAAEGRYRLKGHVVKKDVVIPQTFELLEFLEVVLAEAGNV